MCVETNLTAWRTTNDDEAATDLVGAALSQLAMRQRKNAATISGDRFISKDSVSFKDDEEIDTKSKLLSSPKRVFILCLVFRMLNSLLVQTYFSPDEHWQALEVAHHVTFGYGHLTWEWKKGIRSYLHPMLFSLLYKVLALLHLDSPWFMMKAPRLFQAILSAFGDLYLYKLSQALFNDSVAQCALFAQLTNWFMFFCITRTLSNCLETILTVVGLYYWPCFRVASNEVASHSRKWGVTVAAWACAIRPTSAIVWAYVGLLELFMTRNKLKFVFLEVAPIGALVFGLTFLLDRLMYGAWVFVPLNFLKFNFLSTGGDYYGTHKWHWYFTQGFTVMLFTYLPFSMSGIILAKQWKLSGIIAWVLGLYSLLGHKEFRFVLPVLPIALIFAGYSLATIMRPSPSKRKNKLSPGIDTNWSSKMQLSVFFLLVTNLPMALYMSMIHQRGTEDVMNYLAKEALNGNVKSILFLTPCHATPYYSTLHQDVPMHFLDCTPSEVKGIPDESDRFMMDPAGFFAELTKNWSPPSHIVLFDGQEKLLKEILVSHYFQEVQRFFHAHFKVDRDLQASVAVYVLKGQ